MMTYKQKETHASLRNVFLHDSGLLGNMDTAQAISREHEMHREDLQAKPWCSYEQRKQVYAGVHK